MEVLGLTVQACFSACPDGYEVQGRRAVKGGIGDLLGNSHRVVVPKTRRSADSVCDDLTDIWRSLIRINNLSRVARESTVYAQIVRFCEQYGEYQHAVSAARMRSRPMLVNTLLAEAQRMSEAIVAGQGDFVEMPRDVLSRLEDAIEQGITVTGCLVAVTLRCPVLAAWFGLSNRLANRAFDDWRDCAFCGGVSFSRKRSRFCSDYCRDRYKKREMRRA